MPIRILVDFINNRYDLISLRAQYEHDRYLKWAKDVHVSWIKGFLHSSINGLEHMHVRALCVCVCVCVCMYVCACEKFGCIMYKCW